MTKVKKVWLIIFFIHTINIVSFEIDKDDRYLETLLPKLESKYFKELFHHFNDQILPHKSSRACLQKLVEKSSEPFSFALPEKVSDLNIRTPKTFSHRVKPLLVDSAIKSESVDLHRMLRLKKQFQRESAQGVTRGIVPR